MLALFLFLSDLNFIFLQKFISYLESKQKFFFFFKKRNHLKNISKIKEYIRNAN